MSRSAHGTLVLSVRLALLFVTAHCLASTTDDDAVRARCTRWHHSAMLRDNSIFVDGGVQLFRKAGNTWLGFNKYMFEIDLSKPWDLRTNFTEKRIGRFGDSSMGSNPPNMIRGGLWRGPPNDSRLYTFGGSTFLANKTDMDWKPPENDRYSLWSYDTASMKWAQYDISYAIPRRPNWGAVAEAVDLGIGFSLNGQIDKGSSDVMYTMGEYVGGSLSNNTQEQTTYLGGLSIIDMFGPVKARNVSTDSLGPPRVASGLIYAPSFGKTMNGSLITFGGLRSVDLSTNSFRNGAMIGFETVSVCDSWQDPNPIWFTQPTSGEIPPPRIDFCVLPMPKLPKDGSSHNFYMYGGYDPIGNIMYDDVWVISLPSFKWVKLDSGGPSPRFGHSCHWAGTSHMISIGGSLDAAMYGVETSGQIPPNLEAMKCDPIEGVRIFDLSLGTWGTYSPGPQSPVYKVPAQVVAVIGGSPDGNAAITSPPTGWANPAIATMFDQSRRVTTQHLLSTTPPSQIAGPPQPLSQRPNYVNIAAIAGGVIGGVVGSLSLLCLAILYHRHTSLHPPPTPSSSEGDTPHPYDHPPYDPYDDEPKELPGAEIYAKELRGSVLNHELEAKVPRDFHHGQGDCHSPAELESPRACHEKEGSTPLESPTLPVAEYACGAESEGTREGSLREMPMLPVAVVAAAADGEGVGEEAGLGIVRADARLISISPSPDDGVAVVAGQDVVPARTQTRLVPLSPDDVVPDDVVEDKEKEKEEETPPVRTKEQTETQLVPISPNDNVEGATKGQ